MTTSKITRRNWNIAASSAFAFTFIPRRVWGAKDRFYVAGIGVRSARLDQPAYLASRSQGSSRQIRFNEPANAKGFELGPVARSSYASRLHLCLLGREPPSSRMSRRVYRGSRTKMWNGSSHAEVVLSHSLALTMLDRLPKRWSSEQLPCGWGRKSSGMQRVSSAQMRPKRTH